MGVRKRIRPTGYGLDFSLLSLKLRLSKYFKYINSKVIPKSFYKSNAVKTLKSNFVKV
jgi:hypothetical protein